MYRFFSSDLCRKRYSAAEVAVSDDQLKFAFLQSTLSRLGVNQPLFSMNSFWVWYFTEPQMRCPVPLLLACKGHKHGKLQDLQNAIGERAHILDS